MKKYKCPPRYRRYTQIAAFMCKTILMNMIDEVIIKIKYIFMFKLSLSIKKNNINKATSNKIIKDN